MGCGTSLPRCSPRSAGPPPGWARPATAPRPSWCSTTGSPTSPKPPRKPSPSPASSAWTRPGSWTSWPRPRSDRRTRCKRPTACWPVTSPPRSRSSSHSRTPSSPRRPRRPAVAGSRSPMRCCPAGGMPPLAGTPMRTWPPSTPRPDQPGRPGPGRDRCLHRRRARSAARRPALPARRAAATAARRGRRRDHPPDRPPRRYHRLTVVTVPATLKEGPAMSKTIAGRAHQRADRHGRKAGPGSAVAQTAGPGRPGLGLILAASFMVVLDFSIVNVALPSIQRELGISTASVQWVVTAYAIAFGGLLILGGRAGDLYGRRRLFLAGIGVFTAASLAGGLARDPVLLIAARVVQGGGAAMVAPTALSLITTGFPEGPRRTRALGLYGATASVGFVAGQVAGGVLVEFLSWRSVFLVNVPVGLAALLLAPRVLAESRLPRAGRHLDTVGAALITVAVGALVFAVSQAAITGVSSASALLPLGLAAAAAAAFVAGARRRGGPL